jgi:hypothetical protein
MTTLPVYRTVIPLVVTEPEDHKDAMPTACRMEVFSPQLCFYGMNQLSWSVALAGHFQLDPYSEWCFSSAGILHPKITPIATDKFLLSLHRCKV